MNKSKFFITALLLILLVLIRFFEKQFLNDGLIDFFHHAYLKEDLPAVPAVRVLVTDSLRFWLNAVISMAILYTWFKQTDLLKFLLLIYLVVFVVVAAWFYYDLIHYREGEYIRLFYLRRILIQPLLLFLLIPALYYQQKSQER